MDIHYPCYLFLGYGSWARREDVPASLLAPDDHTVAAAHANPSKIDPMTGRAFGAVWLDAADDIRRSVEPLLDRAAVNASVEADELRKRGNLRALDAMLSRRTPRP